MKIFALSDLHTDYKENLSFIEVTLRENDFSEDVILIPGDVSHDLPEIEKVLKMFVNAFEEVFFVPGYIHYLPSMHFAKSFYRNHDLWVVDKKQREHGTVFDRLSLIDELCERIGVRYRPRFVGDGVAIVPLYAWYSRDFLEGTTDANVGKLNGWGDASYCNFPKDKFPSQEAICTHFDDLNAEILSSFQDLSSAKSIISFSHFVARRELLPPTLFLHIPEILNVMGTKVLEQRIRSLGSDIHICGHSHIGHDSKINGIRYINHPLRYPRERARYGIRPTLKIPMKNLTLEANGGSIEEFSSQYHHESRASNLLSQNTGIVWFSNVLEPLPQFVIIKLGSLYNIGKVGIFLHGENSQNPKHMRILLSEDNKEYKEVINGEIEHRAGDFLFDIAETATRFIKYEITENFGGSGIYVSKMYAYGPEQTLNELK